MYVGSGDDDSLASKLMVSPTLISCKSALPRAFGVVELSPDHPTRLAESIITTRAIGEHLQLESMPDLLNCPLIGLLQDNEVGR